MTIPILKTKDGLIDPQNIAVVFSDTDGNCRLVETSPAEKQTIVRKLASNRQWQTKRYVTHEVVLIDAAMANRISAFIAHEAETNEVAKEIFADLRGEDGVV